MNPDFSAQEADRNKRLLFAAQAVIADASCENDMACTTVAVDRSIMDDLHAIVREFHDAALREIDAVLRCAREKETPNA